MQVLTPRDVPLGGLRAMSVRRTLPQRERTLVGAWCFADHYGPDEVTTPAGWSSRRTRTPDCRPSAGCSPARSSTATPPATTRSSVPGELNLMTGGRGISHSEVSTRRHHHAARRPALGGAARRRARCSRSGLRALRATPGSTGPGWRPGVFLGSLLGTPRRCVRRPRCSAPSWCWSPAPAGPRRRRVLRARRPARRRLASSSTGSRSSRPSSRTPTRAQLARPGGPRGEPAGAAGRAAVRRADRDVVELRRPHPRRGRRAPRGVAGPDRPRRRGRRRLPRRRRRAVRDRGVGDHLPPIPAPPLPDGRLKPRAESTEEG